MKDFVLYCKSYSRDFLRLKQLLDSVKLHNLDQIPFYISTPTSEKALLEEVLGKDSYQWVADEEIVAANSGVSFEQYQAMPGGLSQQIIKAEFWRLGIAENYLCLDSDSKFIRDFRQSDFVRNDNVPYTVLHQNKELFQIASNRGHHKVERDLKVEAERVQKLFGRVGPHFYCAPAPFNWSAKVWQSLDQEYLQPKDISIWDLITLEHPESLIYGEALMKYHAIPLIAVEPLFRTYHYDWQYFLMRRLGETEAKLAQNYFGVIYQSAWDIDGHLGSSNKSLPSRLLRRIKRFGRYLQSYV
ncbi:MAG: hypothetical protein B7Y05_04580 [Polynucleobacter sp. 24-46-87]|uniref:DUF6492 family protein n=1 Tax=unclassified Polynucleobacter TaxID=2640945 RepID=UPI000BD1CF2A|nr:MULTISPECIES: DUF6492 family protein [unclassified Polynucleobacter]OYY18086.1 MAG: hypothetical protein B7Y67_07290 [Polynucleobacter sp. 35-46-11]OZA15269.1 MAG: hypothetical protein B7Y05_04580 [Polynucleobacter sp. 24-46-87]OZA76275.1 MAG: hypothetical protein B7X71_08950 [Polynucleobacter sp. 39-46-10]